MEDEEKMTFDMVRNYPTERRFIRLKPISNSIKDTLKRLLSGRG